MRPLRGRAAIADVFLWQFTPREEPGLFFVWLFLRLNEHLWQKRI